MTIPISALTAVQEWMVNDMRIDEAIKFAEHAQTMTDIPEVKEFYAMAEKALRTQNQVHWISVEDRLPTGEDATGGFVIAIENDKERRVKPWHFDIVVKYANEFTHWMPLPEPPEKED